MSSFEPAVHFTSMFKIDGIPHLELVFKQNHDAREDIREHVLGAQGDRQRHCAHGSKIGAQGQSDILKYGNCSVLNVSKIRN